MLLSKGNSCLVSSRACLAPDSAWDTISDEARPPLGGTVGGWMGRKAAVAVEVKEPAAAVA